MLTPKKGPRPVPPQSKRLKGTPLKRKMM